MLKLSRRQAFRKLDLKENTCWSIISDEGIGHVGGSLGCRFCFGSFLVSDTLVVGARNVDLHSRGLLLEVIEIILRLCKLGLRIL